MVTEAPFDPLSPGDRVLDKYVVTRAIERGGMSVVYAGNQDDGREVAIKALPKKLRTRVLHLRFLREARLAMQIDHPNVVQTLDAGMIDDVPVIVMERLRGSTLADDLRKGGAFSLRVAITIVRDVLRGAGAAHERGVVHRDIKPSNVFRHADGIKLIDFGLSKDLANQGQLLTGPGEALGTPSYMAPEQVLVDAVDARTDLHAVGLLLYELVVGERAFPARESVQKLFERILTQPVPDASEKRPELGPAIDLFIARATHKTPAKRFASAEEMSAALRRLLPPR